VIILKIGFFNLKGSVYYSLAYNQIFTQWGHEFHEGFIPQDFFNDDITFLALHSFHMRDRSLSHFKEIFGKSKCVVLLQMEQIHRNELYLSGYTEEQKYANFVLEQSPEMFSYTTSVSTTPVIFAPFGYHESMTRIDNTKYISCVAPVCDVFALEYATPKRDLIINALNKNNIIRFGPLTSDVDFIAKCANSAKVCLNTESYDNPILATVRVINLFMANKGFVLSCKTDYPYFLDGDQIVYYNNISDLIAKTIYYINHQDEAREIAERGFEYIKKNLRMDNFLKTAMEEMGFKI
jgi:hypothetical protein